MGVMGTYCRVCGLPVQHDHYVQQSGGGGFKIYRGGEADGGHTWAADESPVRFGPQHQWLQKAVAVSRDDDGEVFTGVAHDGVVTDAERGETTFVGNGDEDAWVFHLACWQLIGSPSGIAPEAIARNTHEWSMVSPYAGQLFDFAALLDDGKGWMLDDPSGSERSRARIEASIAATKLGGPVYQRGTTVGEVLAADRGWEGRLLRNPKTDERSDFVRYRFDVRAELVDRASYPALVWLMKEYDGDGLPSGEVLQQLETFERALKSAVETDAAAILVLATVGHGQGQYLIYARDEKTTCALIDALPGRDVPTVADFDNEIDPEWKVYFDQMDPRRYFG